MRRLKTVLLFCIIFLVGCGRQGSTEELREDVFQESTTTENQSAEEPDVTEESDVTGEQTEEIVLETVSVSIKGNKNVFYYDGDTVHIPYEYAAVGSESFGIMVLCDGIAVPFSTPYDNEERTLHIIPTLPGGETVDVDISFVPIGKKGDTVSVQIVDIVEPDYDISSIDLSGNIMPLIHGKKYWVRYICGINVIMNEDGAAGTEEVSEDYTFEEIPQDVIEDNMTVLEDGTVENKLEYFRAKGTVNGEEQLCHSVKQGEKLMLSIDYYGTKGQDIYTSVYLDNEIFPAFDGKKYSKAYIDAEHYTTVEGEIDTAKLEKGRYICYSVCGNIIYGDSVPIETFIIEVR